MFIELETKYNEMPAE